MPKPETPHGEKVVATNRKALHEFFILDTYEAGIALTGTEVKSLREGRINLGDSYVRMKRGSALLVQAHISPYSHGNRENHDPLRDRQLLLHQQEIRRLIVKVQERGLTIVPLRVYFKGGRAKVEIAVAKGKKLYDKRESKKQETVKREIKSAMKARNR
jgi:SsrA-binding protein